MSNKKSSSSSDSESDSPLKPKIETSKMKKKNRKNKSETPLPPPPTKFLSAGIRWAQSDHVTSILGPVYFSHSTSHILPVLRQ